MCVCLCVCVLEQPQAHLESLSSLKFTASLQALKDREIPVPSLPLCLQDDGTTDDLQEAYEKAQVRYHLFLDLL